MDHLIRHLVRIDAPPTRLYQTGHDTGPHVPFDPFGKKIDRAVKYGKAALP